MPDRLLILEPDAEQQRLYREALPAAEFLLLFEGRGDRGREAALAFKPACVILEARLPGLSGLELCLQLRQEPAMRQTALFFVSEAAERADQVAGLQSGADEYLPKPFHPTELLWRVRGLLRRYRATEVLRDPVLRRGPISLDTDQGLCEVKGRPLRLTPKEFALLETFLRRPGRVLKRRYLLETVWGFGEDLRTRVVDLTLLRLRKKLGAEGKRLETLPGFGYRLNS